MDLDLVVTGAAENRRPAVGAEKASAIVCSVTSNSHGCSRENSKRVEDRTVVLPAIGTMADTHAIGFDRHLQSDRPAETASAMTDVAHLVHPPAVQIASFGEKSAQEPFELAS